MTLQEAIANAYAADDAFAAALKAAKLTRWDWSPKTAPQSVLDAFCAKIAADNKMHAAFEESRRA